MQRIVSFLVLIGIAGVVGFLALKVLSGFLLPLFIAVLLVVMFRPVQQRMARHLGGRERLAAGITTLCIVLIFLLPMMWFISRAATDTLALVSEFDPQSIARGASRLRTRFDLESPPLSLEKALADVDAGLDRLRDASSASADFSKETELRHAELNQLIASTNVLMDELWPSHVKPTEDPKSKTREERITAAFTKLQDAVPMLSSSVNDQLALATKVREARGDVADIREALYGGPIKTWLRGLFKFDETQLAEWHGELQAVARPLALGTTQFLGSFLVQMLVGIAVMVVALYYFLADGPEMIDQLRKLTPLDNRYEAQLLDEFGQLTRAILVAMLLSAFAQGALASIGYALAGFDSIFLLSVLTMVFAIVPFIGAIPIWGSCSLWLVLHEGRPQAAVALAVYGIVLGVIGDNLIKPWVLHGRSNLHPLLGLLSVLGGVQALGMIGIVVGPMAVAILQTLLVMVRTELTAMESHPDTATTLTIDNSVLTPEQRAATGESLVST